MKFINQDDRTSKIIITVDQEKLSTLCSMINVLKYDEDNKLLDFKNHQEEIDIKLSTKDKSKFTNLFNELLTAPPKLSGFINNNIIEQQKDELLYLYIHLKKLNLNRFSTQRTQEAKKILLSIIELLEASQEVDAEDSIKISIKKKNGKANKLIELPQAINTKDLYNEIANSIYRYFSRHPTSMRLELYLNAHKETVTSSVLRKFYNEIKDRSLSAEPKIGILVPFYIFTLLPYLSSLPQFPPSKKENSSFSEDQARFFLKFFQLFGLLDHSCKLNLTGNFPEMTEKQLRKKYISFVNKYIE